MGTPLKVRMCRTYLICNIYVFFFFIILRHFLPFLRYTELISKTFRKSGFDLFFKWWKFEHLPFVCINLRRQSHFQATFAQKQAQNMKRHIILLFFKTQTARTWFYVSSPVTCLYSLFHIFDMNMP